MPTPKVVQLYETFGCSFTISGDEAQADECPYCGKDRFYVNTETGKFKCHSANSCGKSGNALTFVRDMYSEKLAATTDDDYRRLGKVRSLSMQTLKRHGLAWDPIGGCWLLPFKAEDGEVANLQRYFPETGKKLSLPFLPLCLHGRDELSAPDEGKVLIVCEGPWDAVALDPYMRTKSKNRHRYDILAVPSSSVFKPEWCSHFAGREVRLCFDNDKAGREGQERIAKLCREQKTNAKLYLLRWPDQFPEGCDLGDLIRDGEISPVKWTRDNCVKVTTTEKRLKFTSGDAGSAPKVEWIDRKRLPLGEFVSFSGPQGSGKSTLMRDIAARVTAGLPMPHAKEALMPPSAVLYFTAEDSEEQIRDILKLHDGINNNFHVLDMAKDAEGGLDLLNHLDEIADKIIEENVRLVVIDPLNSFVGGDISTDAKARRTLTNPLIRLAKRTGACIVGVRNWGRQSDGTGSDRSLGAVSLGHGARVVLNTEVINPDPVDPRFRLVWEKLSVAQTPEPLLYSMEDLSEGSDEYAYRRRIDWLEDLDAAEAELRERTKKGSKKR